MSSLRASGLVPRFPGDRIDLRLFFEGRNTVFVERQTSFIR